MQKAHSSIYSILSHFGDNLENLNSSNLEGMSKIQKDNISQMSREYHQLIQEHKKICAENNSLKIQNAELNHFSHILAHDFRTPCRNISNFSAIIQSDKSNQLSSTSSIALNKIQSATNRLYEMVEAMRSLSRAQNQDNIRTSINIGELFQQVQEAHEFEIRELLATVSVGTMPTCQLNEPLTWILLDNLLRNALIHGAEPHEISLLHVVDQNSSHFEFKNSARNRITDSKLFEPFQRGTNCQTPGTGLGLYICKKIVDAHSGQIWLESSDTSFGVCFTLTEKKNG